MSLPSLSSLIPRTESLISNDIVPFAVGLTVDVEYEINLHGNPADPVAPVFPVDPNAPVAPVAPGSPVAPAI